MSRQLICVGPVAALLLAGSIACRPQQPFFFYEDGDLSHYVGMATDIEYPDVDVASLDDVEQAQPPFTLDNQMLDESKLWDLPLEEAVRIALENSKVIRLLDPAFNPDGRLLASSRAVTTIYDPALSESDPRFGVEGALAAFDAAFSTNIFWEQNDAPRNGFLSPAVPGLASFGVFQQDLGTFQAQISKLNATGGRTTIRHNVNYDSNNANDLTPGLRQFDSDWNVNVEAEIRQPLLQGAGVQFNRIAGPGSIPGFYNGVMIARLRTDQSLVDFEAAVRNLASDVERAYWELYLRYRVLDVMIEARDRALGIWQKAQARLAVAGLFETTSEARARYEYFQFRSQVEDALNAVYQGEANLRYVMGIAPNDGRLIRPITEPTTAKVEFDWSDVQAEALVRSPELRRQKWVIKQRELELIAAKNYLL
ncbi:MAG TPA: TolC family protein, partial [Planctomycetaceae bacterium]|nr:TolC family protein [Planctomycetaceae bacterium]